MNIQRLKQAIEIIKDIPDAQLNLHQWQYLTRKDVAEGKTAIHSPEEVTCGTIACAAGWLCLDARMQEQGLHARGPYGVPCFNTSVTWSALSEFFDISFSDARDLFDQRTTGEEFESLTDKQIWLRRANNLLEQAKSQGVE